MNRLLLSTTVAGLSFLSTGCGESDDPVKTIEQRIETLESQFDCIDGPFGVGLFQGDRVADIGGLASAQYNPESHTIEVSEEFIDLEPPESVLDTLVEHEFAHGCREEKVLAEPLQLPFSNVYGFAPVVESFDGFNVQIIPPDEGTGLYNLLEEAYATYFERAHRGRPDLEGYTLPYEVIADLFEYKMKKAGIDYVHVRDLHTDSDVATLTSILTSGSNENSEGTGEADLLAVLEEFSLVAQNGESYLVEKFPDIHQVLAE